MDTKGKRCYTCGHFQRYYTKGIKKFDNTKFGRCCVKDAAVSSCNSCEHWKNRPPQRHIKWASLKALNDILIDIKAIRQVIEDAMEDDKLR